jgi:hypothetical protein
MPFKSDAQRKLCYLLKGKGQAGSWDCSEWSEATGGKKLPEHVEDQTEKKALGITNKLKGGVGDNKNPADLDKAELNSGIKEEKEHTNDTDVATEIAVDHLTEEPKYYSKMEKVEKKSSVQTSQPSRFAALLAKVAAVRPGLWANIRAKKRRGETTAKPGDEDYPDSKNWDKVTAISEKKAQCWEGYERVPGTKALTPGSCRPTGKKKEAEKQSGAAWQTAEGKNPEGGLNDKGRASLKAQGHDIKRPQPEGGSRKDSFCARMGGMKAKLTSSATANDPDSRINKALRKWKCGSDAFEQIALLAKSAMDSVYSPQQPQQPQQQWMQQPQQQPIFVINSAPSQSGIMTGLGNLTAAGGGIAGAGSLAVNYGANKGIPALQRYDQFEPNLLNRVDQFNTKMNSPTLNAAEKLKAYVEHGTDLIQQPVWTRPDGTKLIGRDMIEQVYKNPITTMIADGSQPNMKWSPSLSEHYGQFNKGPAAAYAQLGAELLGDDAIQGPMFQRQFALHEAARNNKISLLGTAAARNDVNTAKAVADRAAIARKMDTMQGKVKSKVENLIERLRGKGLLGEREDAWASKFRPRLQLRHDRMNEFSQKSLAPQDEIINKLNSRGDFIKNKLISNGNNLSGDALKQHLTGLADASKERILNSIAPVLPGDKYGLTRNAMQDELLQLAKSKPEFASSLGRGLESLSRDQQLKLVDYAHRTPLGQSMTSSFGDPTSLAFRTNSYGNLSNAIAAPKRILNWGVSNLGRLAAKSRIGAMLSLPVVGSGLAMRYLGGSQDAANSEAATQSMVDKIRKALNSNVLPALTPEATPYASLPKSGILPSLIGKPYIGKQSSDYIAALAKQAATQAGGSYLNRVVALNEQDTARMKDQAARVRAASGIPNPTGNGTHSWGGHVFPDRVENPTYNFTPPAATPPIPYTGLGSQYLNGAEGRLPYPLLRTAPAQSGQAFTPKGGTVPPSAPISSLRDHPAFRRNGLSNSSMFKEDFNDMATDRTKVEQLQNAIGGVGNGTHQGVFSGGKIQPDTATFTPKNLPSTNLIDSNPEASPPSNFAPETPGYLTPGNAAAANLGSSILNGAQYGGMGNILTGASTYDSGTQKTRNGKNFYRGDLQTQPGPTNVTTNIDANTGAFNQQRGASGNSRASATSGSFRTATPKPANTWKPIDISGERREKEKQLGLPEGSMNEGGEHYAKNGPRSAELAKAPASISNTYVAPPGEDPQHTALNKAMFDIKKEQRVALASGKTWSPSGVNIINPVKPTAMAQAPAPKAPSNTYATSRFSSDLPSWATQGR